MTDHSKLMRNFKVDISNDIVIENQRGITLIGYTLYSPHLLIPRIDPPQYQIIYFDGKEGDDREQAKITFTSLSNKILHSFEQLYPMDFQLNETASKQHKWYVLMSVEDTDDDGWDYSWSFRSKRWKYKNGLVRRRVWVRLPEVA
ncbi:similar to Saccharomyces cerevisiae YER046W SPO73 Meiosis-specific protein of unknown function, required for spore wall formation during sporulation [Maudiozyma saulgeensis]|uniref:Peroxin/Ferlin domain-containing protein n=1 Tax=Maudiozyma saulgeensis TaxID=1789683 RepID=A0A1X7R3Y6_9SACH|nr:similar to Saccharomyces cerevisiae YER046W SPO73 Meiosis-specific protein of unknown function, required for spore wall formation during sporulation [Kazachstania saulgeensis]